MVYMYSMETLLRGARGGITSVQCCMLYNNLYVRVCEDIVIHRDASDDPERAGERRPRRRSCFLALTRPCVRRGRPPPSTASTAAQPPQPPAPGPPNASRPNILFLMCDSMDGRVLDPTSQLYAKLEMPNLRKLAARGVNFVNTYAASPQCVPSRTTMFTGRRIDQTKTWNNGQGVAVIPGSGSLDATCVREYAKTCRQWRAEQNISRHSLTRQGHPLRAHLTEGVMRDRKMRTKPTPLTMVTIQVQHWAF